MKSWKGWADRLETIRPSAYTMMAISVFWISWMSVFTRMASKSLPAGEIVFYRSLLMCLFLWFWAHSRGISLRGVRFGLLLARGAAGAGGLYCFVYAITKITLVEATALNLASPVFIVLLAHLALGEKMRPLEFALLFVALGGALLIIQPTRPSFQMASWVGLGSAGFASVAHILVRVLSKTDSKTVIIWFLSLSSMLCTAPFLFFASRLPTPAEGGLIVGIAGCALLGQFALTMAFSLERAGPVSIVSYLGVFFSGLWGFLLWSEIPNALAALGCLLLVASCLALSSLRSA